EALYAQVRAAGTDLRVDVDPAPHGTQPAAVELAVYRILQEALTNALRHGGEPVALTLSWHADRVEMSVRNPLSGSPELPLEASRGHGLIGMRERAQLVGGRLDAGPIEGEFVVHGQLPIEASA
ncbi:sensor histidine kinase, partial [Rhizobium johnstonii]